MPLIAGVIVDRCSYHSWHGCIRIANRQVEAVVAPEIGRIIRFARRGGPNLLYEGPLGSDHRPVLASGWRNYGGDKVWPAPQSNWGWPPEAAYDTAPWKAKVVGTAIVFKTTQFGDKTGFGFERRLTLGPKDTFLTIQNIAINGGSKPAKVAVWEVCQVNDPAFCVLPRYVSPKMPRGWAPFDTTAKNIPVTVEANRVVIRRDHHRGLKYGAASPVGGVSARVGGDTVTLWTKYFPGREYVDGGKAQQVYTNSDDAKYAELEVTGPVATVAAHARLIMESRLTVSKG